MIPCVRQLYYRGARNTPFSRCAPHMAPGGDPPAAVVRWIVSRLIAAVIDLLLVDSWGAGHAHVGCASGWRGSACALLGLQLQLGWSSRGWSCPEEGEHSQWWGRGPFRRQQAGGSRPANLYLPGSAPVLPRSTPSCPTFPGFFPGFFPGLTAPTFGLPLGLLGTPCPFMARSSTWWSPSPALGERRCRSCRCLRSCGTRTL